MSLKTDQLKVENPLGLATSSRPVVLMVVDDSEACPKLMQFLQQRGYDVIATDHGLEAAQHARKTHPDLLVVDMDVPLLFELVAARQIMKHGQMGLMPVVIVTHDDVVDSAPLMEVGTNREEFVTRLSDYEELKPLLDYLLPTLPRGTYTNSIQGTATEIVRPAPPDTLALT